MSWYRALKYLPPETQTTRAQGIHFKSDERILGDSDFVESVLKEQEIDSFMGVPLFYDCYSKDFTEIHKSRQLYLKFMRLTNFHEGPSTLNQFYVDQRQAGNSQYDPELNRQFAIWYLTKGMDGSDNANDVVDAQVDDESFNKGE
ncbi:MAG: hypothetical protein JRJ60_22735 [Deltaproteobacteria bacterium]|nr:hypothetical protein [Deltaproteobacteria bacterium]